ncbi:hypothetical protein TSUD_03400 [Trifolium subterraneum]|nr:hypothetical protein TSUD_03400 [Trifolium subterraneum]
MVIEKEGSFMMDFHETYEIGWDEGMELEIRGEGFARAMRAVVESILECHFGSHIMDELFRRYAQLVDNHLSNTRAKLITFIISLVKQH